MGGLFIKDAGVWKEQKMLWVKDAGVWKEIGGGGLDQPWVERAYFTYSVNSTSFAQLTVENLVAGDLLVALTASSYQPGTLTGDLTLFNTETTSPSVKIWYKLMPANAAAQTLSYTTTSSSQKRLTAFVIKNASSLGYINTTTTAARIPSMSNAAVQGNSIIIGAVYRGIVDPGTTGYAAVGSGFYSNIAGTQTQKTIEIAPATGGDTGVTGGAIAVEVRV